MDFGFAEAGGLPGTWVLLQPREPTTEPLRTELHILSQPNAPDAYCLAAGLNGVVKFQVGAGGEVRGRVGNQQLPPLGQAGSVDAGWSASGRAADGLLIGFAGALADHDANALTIRSSIPLEQAASGSFSCLTSFTEMTGPIAVDGLSASEMAWGFELATGGPAFWTDRGATMAARLEQDGKVVWTSNTAPQTSTSVVAQDLAAGTFAYVVERSASGGIPMFAALDLSGPASGFTGQSGEP